MDDTINKNDIDEIILKEMQLFWKGEISKKQLRHLNDWKVYSIQNKRVFREYSKFYYRIKYAENFNKIILDKERFIRIIKVQRNRKIYRFIISIAAAACFLLFGMFLYKSYYYSEIDKSINSKILVQKFGGRTLPILQLANGEELTLSSDSTFNLKEGNIKIMNFSNKILSYNVISENSSLKISETQVKYNTLRIPRGGEYMLKLSDGTKVWLNSDTELKYPVTFSGKTREVKVVGEAFFDVVKDVKHPFIVYSENVKVKVLGTKFNVMAYKDEDIIQVTLESGRVLAMADEKTSILEPGMQATIIKNTNILSTKKVNVKQFISWRDGIFDFYDISLEDLCVKLARWYDVDFFFLNKNMEELKFTGAVKRTNSLSFVLDILKKTSKIDYIIKNNVVQIYER